MIPALIPATLKRAYLLEARLSCWTWVGVARFRNSSKPVPILATGFI